MIIFGEQIFIMKQLNPFNDVHFKLRDITRLFFILVQSDFDHLFMYLLTNKCFIYLSNKEL